MAISLKPEDLNSSNPRIQCDKCGHWTRVAKADGEQINFAVGVDQDWCITCIEKPENQEEYVRLQKESGAL